MHDMMTYVLTNHYITICDDDDYNWQSFEGDLQEAINNGGDTNMITIRMGSWW